MRIDLGCGSQKFRNCVGIDRIAYPDTDLICDMNQPLPLEDDTVDFVMASHSLEYVEDLQAVMQEIYRVCRHKAIVCIVAPYANVSSHLVNPQYKQLFNEHSPRYWTLASESIVDSDDYMLSPYDTWSLLKDGQAAIDFRVLRMEFFYFPAFQIGYDAVELSLLRQSQWNVAYDIMFHLIVAKKPITTEELLYASRFQVMEEPAYVRMNRELREEDDGEEPLFNLEHMSPIIEQRKAKAQEQRKETSSAVNRRSRSKKLFKPSSLRKTKRKKASIRRT